MSREARIVGVVQTPVGDMHLGFVPATHEIDPNDPAQSDWETWAKPLCEYMHKHGIYQVGVMLVRPTSSSAPTEGDSPK